MPAAPPVCLDLPVDTPAQVKARGAPAPGDTSVAAHLLRLRDPVTNEPLADDLLAGEFGFYFMAGVETTGNSITWTL